MKKSKSNSKLNNFLLFWYVLLILILPIISLIAAFYIYQNLWEDESFWGSANFFLFFFVNMPIYGIYTTMIIKGYFPTSNKKALLLFIPLVISYTTFFIDNGFDGFWSYVFINSLPLYLGLNLIFFAGLLVLIAGNIVDASFKELAGKLIAMLILITIIFYAPAYFLFFGINIHTEGTSSYEEIRNLVKYFLTIILMAILHFNIVKKLFNEGAF